MRKDAIRNRQQVLEVAERLFASQGLAVEMDDIAREAGVGVGTVYRHFRTKEALFQALVGSHVERLIDAANAFGKELDAGEAFFDFLALFVEQTTAKRHLTDALSRSELAHPCGSPEELESRRVRFRGALGALLERAQRGGAVRGDIRVPELVAVIQGAFCSLEVHGGDAGARQRLFALVVDGLRAR